jgi:predicted TIM-barrel fold metal-dependent hydrolase
MIDCHTHFYDPRRPEGVPWPGKGTPLYRTVLPKDLREQPMFHPLTGTVVVEASPWVEDNAWLLELASKDHFILGVIGNLKPGTPEFAGQLDRFAADRLFRGIRISAQTVKELLDRDDLSDLKRMAVKDLTLDVNGGPETPALVARLAARLGDLKIVQNHMGNVKITKEPPPRDWSEGIAAAGRHRNVRCKISAFMEAAARDGAVAPQEPAFYRPYLDVIWNAFGEDRVIYGSNWPVSDRAGDYAAQQRLSMEFIREKNPAALPKFLALNAKQAYGLVARSQ